MYIAFQLHRPHFIVRKVHWTLGRPRARVLISRASSGANRQPQGNQADGEAASGAPAPARQESPQQQLDVEPSASTCSPEVAAAASPIPQQQAWQAVQHYLHQADAQAKRSPAATLVTVGVVAVAAMVVGSVLRRYIFGGRAVATRPAPTVEELLLKEGLLGPQQAKRRQQAQQAQQPAQQQPAPVEGKLPSQPEPAQGNAQQDCPAAPAAPAAAPAAAAAAAAQVLAEDIAVTASSGLADAAAAGEDGPITSSATTEPLAPSAPVADEARAAAEEVKEAAGEAESGLVHALVELEEVFVLQAPAPGGAAGAAGTAGAAGSKGSALRMDIEVQGQEQRCFIVFEELQDAEALRRPLCALYGVEPQRLVPAAVPPAELLGGAGGQPVAFLPAGALRLLDSVTREGMASLLQDDDEAAAFAGKLQQLLSQEADVLAGDQVTVLAAAAARAGSKPDGGMTSSTSKAAGAAAAASSRAAGGQGPAAAQEVDVEVMLPGAQQSRASSGTAGQQEGQPLPAEWHDTQAASQQQQQGQQQQQQQQQQSGAAGQPLAVPGLSPAAAGKSPAPGGSGSGSGSGGSSSVQGAELGPDWWLSLPVVHVPQLCYDDGGKGLIVIPVASLKGALQDMASMGGEEGRAGGSRGWDDRDAGLASANGASSNGNGASAVGSNGSGQQRGYSRPVERHIIAFQDLEDAKALSLCTLASEQGAAATRVRALAMPPAQLLRYAESAGCVVAVLPRGEVLIQPRERLEDAVERLHDAVQDWYWRRMAEGMRQYQQDQE